MPGESWQRIRVALGGVSVSDATLLASYAAGIAVAPAPSFDVLSWTASSKSSSCVPINGRMFVAEIGDVHRFPDAWGHGCAGAAIAAVSGAALD